MRERGTARAENVGPETAASTFRYATAFSRSSSSCCSLHSVEEVKANSSASQLASRIVRFGRVPLFKSDPNARAISMSTAEPLEGSTPPYVQASRWFPAITHSSGYARR
jgi:hypothetical protein